MNEEHSKKFYQIKQWYDDDMWSKKKVRDAVVKGKITPAEYTEIVGEPYA